MLKALLVTFASLVIIGLLVFLFFWLYYNDLTGQSPYQSINPSNMKMYSTAFTNKGTIPSQYTCDGANFNPPLTIEGVPPEATSLALIMDDPDSPSGTWSHWIAWNIDPVTTAIAENNIPSGITQGVNDFALKGYGGPCPNAGKHHYYFKLYALNTAIDLPPQATKTELEQAMQNHIIAQTELMGIYARK